MFHFGLIAWAASLTMNFSNTSWADGRLEIENAIRTAALRAAKQTGGRLQLDIESLAQRPNPYELFSSKRYFAQLAILKQLSFEQRLAAVEYRVEWLTEFDAGVAYIDSNFSRVVLRDIYEVQRSYFLVKDSLSNVSEWADFARSVYRTLRVLDRVTQKPFKIWVPTSIAVAVLTWLNKSLES